MRFRILIIFISLFVIFPSYALRTKRVMAEYAYYVPSTQSIEEAKKIALERAKTQAIAEEFGTVVMQTNTTSITNNRERSAVDFHSVGSTEVKGEWIETLSTPKYDMLYEDEQFVILVTVEGKIRELSTDIIDFKAKALRNGTNERDESTNFKDGDELFLLFQSPQKGYLLVYLVDDAANTVYQMLPYGSSPENVWTINDDRPHILFSRADAPAGKKDEVDEYCLSIETDCAYNDLYILFSPEPMTRAMASFADGKKNVPKEMNVNDFRKWLNKNRSTNPKLNLNVIPLTITKN